MAANFFIYHALAGKYEWYAGHKDEEERYLRFLGAEAITGKWKPIKLERCNGATKLSDFPAFMGPVPLFSARDWEALSELIGPDVEPLLVRGYRNKPYHAIHVTRIIEGGLDLRRSKYSVNEYAGNTISSVSEYVLNESAIGSAPMFKLAETRDLEVYVSRAFRNAVKRNGLVGLDYIPIGG
jgi:hypothetical protein